MVGKPSFDVLEVPLKILVISFRTPLRILSYMLEAHKITL